MWTCGTDKCLHVGRSTNRDWLDKFLYLIHWRIMFVISWRCTGQIGWKDPTWNLLNAHDSRILFLRIKECNNLFSQFTRVFRRLVTRHPSNFCVLWQSFVLPFHVKKKQCELCNSRAFILLTVGTARIFTLFSFSVLPTIFPGEFWFPLRECFTRPNSSGFACRKCILWVIISRVSWHLLY
jgi:hypothetical protein